MTEAPDPLFINILFRSLSVGLDAKFNNFLAQYNLSPGRYKVLGHLFAAPDSEGLMPSQLALKLGLKLPTISLLIREMELSGLVKRRFTKADRRTRHIHLTEAGRELITRISPEWQLRVHVFLSCLNQKEHQQLDEILKKMLSNVCALDWTCQ